MTLCMKFSWIENVVFCSVKYPEKGPFKCDDDSSAPMGIPGDVKQAFKMNYTYSVTWEVLNMNERKTEYHNQFICTFVYLIDKGRAVLPKNSLEHCRKVL